MPVNGIWTPWSRSNIDSVNIQWRSSVTPFVLRSYSDLTVGLCRNRFIREIATSVQPGMHGDLTLPPYGHLPLRPTNKLGARPTNKLGARKGRSFRRENEPVVESGGMQKRPPCKEVPSVFIYDLAAMTSAAHLLVLRNRGRADRELD